MATYRLKHPKTGEVFVVGSPRERAQLRAEGYKDVTNEKRPEPRPEPKPEVPKHVKPKTGNDA